MGIFYDYKVICDETNNPPENKESNVLNVDISFRCLDTALEHLRDLIEERLEGES